MTQDNASPFSLDGAALGRAWWATPIKMTGWLVALAYLVAWPIAAQMARSNAGTYPSYRQHLAPGTWDTFVWKIGLFTPLWWALGLAVVGFVFGAVGMSIAESKTQKALGFTFLDDAHWLTQRVHGMAAKLGLPKPRVGIMNAVNAFAVGTDRNTASVILGVPLVKGLAPDELDAVIGHELGHIANGDMRGMVFAEGYQNMFSTIFSAIGVLVSIGLAVGVKAGKVDRLSVQLADSFGNLGRVLLGFGSEVLTKGLSRKREFYADAVGAALSTPDAMARALQRLGSLTTAPTPAENKYAYLMFRGSGGSLFSTHPTTETRVAALQSGEYLNRMRAAYSGRQQRREQAQAAARSAIALGSAGAQTAGRAAQDAIQKARTSLADGKAAAPVPPAPSPPRTRIEPRF